MAPNEALADTADKRTCVALIAAVCALDLPRVEALIGEDLHWWSCGTTIAGGSHDRAGFMKLTQGLLDALAAPIVFDPMTVVAENGRVVLEAELRMQLKSGARYCNRYLMLFRVARSRVREVREYFDTEKFTAVFGTAGRP